MAVGEFLCDTGRMNEQQDREEKRKPTRWGLWLVVALVVLVAWFPLTVPPVQRLIRRGYLGRDWALHYTVPFYRVVYSLPKPIQAPYWFYWRMWSNDVRPGD